MTELLQDKVALVTGGAQGIGRSTALAFAAQGAKIIVADVLDAEGEAVAAHIRQLGGEAIFVHCDISQSAAVEAMVARAVETYGRLDCAANNAGIEGEMSPCADCSEENWDRTIAVNLKGVWLCMRAELKQMLKQGGGAIVNVSSVAGLVAERGFPAYSAAKGGVIALTRTAAAEYCKLGIRVNAVCPGVIHTPMIDRTLHQMDLTAMFPEMRRSVVSRAIGGLLSRQAWFTNAMTNFIEPMGRHGEPEEIAQVIVWLCSDAASFVTGQALAADGGMTAT